VLTSGVDLYLDVKSSTIVVYKSMTCLISYTHICNEYNIEEKFNKNVAYSVERVKFKGTMTKLKT